MTNSVYLCVQYTAAHQHTKHGGITLRSVLIFL